MKILLTADPEIPVPPRHYGGIERIIDMLARGLVNLGHSVRLMAHRESSTAAQLVPWSGASSHSQRDTVRNALALAAEVRRWRPDIIHSFSRIAYLTLVLPLSTPKLMTYQRAITPNTVRLGHLLSRGTLSFTAISAWMMDHVKEIGNWSVIPNGVPCDAYEFKASVSPHAPLVFLGRVEEIKGPHLAIDIADTVGARLVIAGNVPDEKQEWFSRMIKPRLDGKRIAYVGPVDDVQKNALLGSARALLMPILWDEPFGIVMAEALACGTPVLGLRRGAVPEVVEDGVTGFVRDEVRELAQCVADLSRIDRAACRARVKHLYSAETVTAGYLEAYRRCREKGN